MYRRTMLKVCLVAASIIPVMWTAQVAEAAEIELRNPTACRLFDSRQIGGLGAGAKISSATIDTTDEDLDTVSFTATVNGVPRSFNYQGGEAGCRVPSTATGVMLNVVVFDPTSLGNATIWPLGAAQPLSTSINSSGALNEVTGIHITLGTDGQLSLAATITAAHYVIDLMGHSDYGNTAAVWGTVDDINIAVPIGGGTLYQYDLDNGMHVACEAPRADAADCAAVEIGDYIVASGHVQNFFGAVYVVVHGEMTIISD